MAIYNLRVRCYAHSYFKEDSYFKKEMHSKLYELALREWLQGSSNVITLKAVAHSELGNRCIKLFNYRLRDIDVDERCKETKLAVRLALYDYIKSLFREFDRIEAHQAM